MEQNKLGAILAIVGGVLGFLGSIGTWATVSVMGLSQSLSGTQADGVFTLILAIAAAITGGLAMKYSPKGLGIATIAEGGVISLIALIDTTRVSSMSSAALFGAEVSLGWGIILTIVAGLVATAGGIVITMNAFKKKR